MQAWHRVWQPSPELSPEEGPWPVPGPTRAPVSHWHRYKCTVSPYKHSICTVHSCAPVSHASASRAHVSAAACVGTGGHCKPAQALTNHRRRARKLTFLSLKLTFLSLNKLGQKQQVFGGPMASARARRVVGLAGAAELVECTVHVLCLHGDTVHLWAHLREGGLGRFRGVRDVNIDLDRAVLRPAQHPRGGGVRNPVKGGEKTGKAGGESCSVRSGPASFVYVKLARSLVLAVCVAQPQCAQTMLASRVGTMEMDSRDGISPPVRSSRAR